MELLISCLSLTFLEIILGIDNVVFVTLAASKLEKNLVKKATNIGLGIALFIRVGLLFFISSLLAMNNELFSLFGVGMSLKDLILLVGGIFLLFSAVKEIHEKMYHVNEDHVVSTNKKSTLRSVITQIALINIAFSFDSLFTAVALTTNVAVMIFSVIASTALMIFFANKVGEFIDKNPTFKILALSFLVMIATLLIADAFHQHISKNYIYFSMFFACLVEFINMKSVRNKK